MTREEAIHILNSLKPTNTKSSFDAYIVGKAITMAIEALSTEPCEDCISRADVRRILNHEVKMLNVNTWKALYEKIDVLPSVQPISANEKEIYNKGWEDGAEATAYHVELCEEENPTIPLSVIEDIKAEIEEESRFCPLTEGLERALEIIDKHISEKNTECIFSDYPEQPYQFDNLTGSMNL